MRVCIHSVVIFQLFFWWYKNRFYQIWVSSQEEKHGRESFILNCSKYFSVASDLHLNKFRTSAIKKRKNRASVYELKLLAWIIFCIRFQEFSQNFDVWIYFSGDKFWTYMLTKVKPENPYYKRCITMGDSLNTSQWTVQYEFRTEITVLEIQK